MKIPNKVFICFFSALLGGAVAFADEVDVWFDLHKDCEWRDLAEKWTSMKDAMRTPVENLVLPVESWDNGAVRTRIKATKAQLLELRYIFAENVTIEMFDDQGGKTGELQAADCLFDRKEKRGYCKGQVQGEKDGDSISSVGMYFSASKQYVRLLSAGEIRTRRFSGTFGRIKR